jgi:hypothetical protein
MDSVPPRRAGSHCACASRLSRHTTGKPTPHGQHHVEFRGPSLKVEVDHWSVPTQMRAAVSSATHRGLPLSDPPNAEMDTSAASMHCFVLVIDLICEVCRFSTTHIVFQTPRRVL